LIHGKYVNEYRKSAVNGASPLQLVIMLYDGALRFMEAGKHAMNLGDLPKQDASLQKAQRIVMELMSCLDLKQGGEVAKNLLALYSYILNQLVDANVGDKTEPIDRCIKVMSELRESWAAVERTSLQPDEHKLAS
jgi:flagellar protein FliS